MATWLAVVSGRLLVAVAAADVPAGGAAWTGATGGSGLALLTYLAVLVGAPAWVA